MFSKQYEYIVALAREGSFSRAAEVLGIRQPSLSQYVKKVEQTIGAELFDRSENGLRLTDAGEAFVAVGRQVLELENGLNARLSEIGDFRRGTVTVRIAALSSVACITEAARRFKELYPGMTLFIDERRIEEIPEIGSHGLFDLCLTTVPVSDRLFHVDSVYPEEDVVALPAGVELPTETAEGRRFPAVSVRELDGMDFVMLFDGHPLQRHLQQLCETYDLSLNRSVECTALAALPELVKAGLGAALLPSSLCRETEGVKYVSLKEQTCTRRLSLIYRHGQRLSQPLKDLIDILRECLTDAAK